MERSPASSRSASSSPNALASSSATRSRQALLEPQEIRIPVRLLKDRSVPALAKLIYGVLDTFVYSGRDASPSLIEIAERSGIVVPNIPRTLRSLQTAGYIAINRDRKRNRYTFLK